MLFQEIIIVYCDFHAKHIITVYGKTAELLNGKAGGKYTYHEGLKVLIIVFEVYLSVLHFEMLTLEMK
jgi:hypothetical protein